MVISALLLLGAAQYGSGPTFAAKPSNAYDFKLADIDGKVHSLKEYKGKTLLIVNVATHCGNTPQYAALESVYEKYKDKGLVVLGFPCNDFGAQEPGTEAEIKTFCTGEYHVTFPMFSKLHVKGDEQAPLYKWLVSQTGGKDVEWNFGKFLIGADGKVRMRFDPKQKPDSDAVISEIEKALATK